MLNSLINQRLGRYTITALLGRGGMAAVYRARDAALQRDVALKVLYPQFTDEQTLVERFKREAITAAGLEQAHIVPVYDVGEQDDLLYIAMKLLSGHSLYDALQARGALPLGELLPILEQVASALDYAHARGVIHRDIKPGNIMLELPRATTPVAAITPVGVARDAPTAQGMLPATSSLPQASDLLPVGTVAILTDFGIAKSLDTPGLTNTGALLGTPDYMAPEQIGGGRVDGRADVYALGVLVYRALTGERLFGGTTQEVLLAHLHTTPAAPSLAHPQVPPALDTPIMRALAKQPAARYGSAGEFVGALRAASASQPAHPPALVPLAEQTTRVTQPRLAPVDAPQLLARPATPAQVVPQRQQNTGLLFLACFAALLLIAGGVLASNATHLFGGSGQAGSAVPVTATSEHAAAVFTTVTATIPSVTASAPIEPTASPETPSTPPPSPTQQPTIAATVPLPSQTPLTPVVVTQIVVVTQPLPPTPRPNNTSPPPTPPAPTLTPSPLPPPPTDTSIPPPPPTDTPAPAACDETPLRQGSGFRVLYKADIAVRGKLGCPAKPGGEQAGKGADQVFDNGTMYWWENLDTVYALPEGANRSGSYRAFNKTQAANLPDPPAEINAKMNGQGGFARVYYGVAEIRNAIGTPVTTERPINGAYQAFEHGIMIYSPANDSVRGKTIYVLYNDGTFRRYDDLNPE